MSNTSVTNTYLYEIEWVNIIEPDTENMIIRRIPENRKKAADGEKEYIFKNFICHN